MTLDELIAELNDMMPDNYVHKQAQVSSDLPDKEILAQYVVKATHSLYDLDSTDQANLERIAFNLEHAALTLTGVARRLRQLCVQV